MEYNRNFFIAIGLSFVVLIAWQFLHVAPKQAKLQKQQVIAQQQQLSKQQSSFLLPRRILLTIPQRIKQHQSSNSQ